MALNRALKQLEAGDSSLLYGILAVLAYARGGNEVFHALTVLVRLAAMGMDPDALWQCRRELAAWQFERNSRLVELDSKALEKADQHWNWPLPRDRYDEGILADLRLWLYCRDRSRRAAAWGRVLMDELSQGKPQLSILVNEAGKQDSRPEFKALLLDVLVSIHGRADKAFFLKHKCCSYQRLLYLFEHWPMDAAQRQALLAAVIDLVPWALLPETVPRLMRNHQALVRAHLMRLSQRDEQWFYRRLGHANHQQGRQFFIQMALMPLNISRAPLRAMTLEACS